MKVIVLSSCYPRPKNYHSGIFVHQQLKALAQLGVLCHVIQPVEWFPPFGLHKLHPYWKVGYKNHKNVFDELEGIRIHHPRVFMKMPSRWFPEHPWRREGNRVTKYILDNPILRDADVVYAQFLVHEGYVGTIVKESTGIPLVSIALGDDVHAWPEKSPQNIPFLREVLEKSDLLLANSLGLARDAENWGEESQNVKVKCVYQGVDLDKFTPAGNSGSKGKGKVEFGLDKNNKYLLCVATPVVLKGWIELLDAFSALKNQLLDWKLLIVAPLRSSTDALDLRKEVSKRGIEEYVDHLGSVDHDKMPRLMQAVDAFILPSYNEGMSNALLEALASGLPSITTDVGGHKEVIDHRINGYLVSPRKQDEIKEALSSVLLDDLLYETLRSNARFAAEKIGSYMSNAMLLKEVFEKVIHRD